MEKELTAAVTTQEPMLADRLMWCSSFPSSRNSCTASRLRHRRLWRKRWRWFARKKRSRS